MSAPMTPVINLARRPFRNNTVHYTVFASCFLLLVAASVYNVYDFVKTGGEISRLQAELDGRTDRYRGLGDDVERMKVDVARLDLTTLNTKSNFANGLILSRLFSWSALFDRIEELIPPDVKIRSIRPAISPKGIEIQIDGMARTPQALYEFEEQLEASNFFTGVYPVAESTRESKTELNFDLMMNYVPAGRDVRNAALPATPTEGLPQAEPETPPAAGEPEESLAAVSGAVEPSPAVAGAAAAGPAGIAVTGESDESAPVDGGQPASATPQVVRRPAPEMTNKEFFEAFGQERLLRARGKLGVRPPAGNPELNNEAFIQKYGIDAFLQARGHLDKASQVIAGAAADSKAGGPR